MSEEVRGSLPGTRRDLLVLAIAAVLATAVMVVMHGAFIEDAFITLGYARNIAEHWHWGLLPDQLSNTQTSPLNALLLAAATVVVRNALVAVWVITIGNAVLLALGLLRLGVAWGVGRRLAMVALPLLYSTPLLVATTGMETMLALTVLIWLLVAGAAGDPRSFGWLTGVAVLIRPDLAVVVLVAWLAHPALRRPVMAAVWATLWRALLMLVPWFVFSWVVLGSFVPDTLLIKRGHRFGHFATALWAELPAKFPGAIGVSLALAGLALVALVGGPLLAHRSRRPWWGVVPALAGMAYYLELLAIGASPYTWYYALPVGGLLLTLAWAVALAPARSLVVVLTVLLVLPAAAYWGRTVREGVPLAASPVYGNWATSDDYRELGEWIAAHHRGETLRSAGEFGEMLYYCDCRIVDRFSARGLLVPMIDRSARDSLWWRINYHFLDRSSVPVPPVDGHIHYSRTEPTSSPRWRVDTPSHGPGWYYFGFP